MKITVIGSGNIGSAFVSGLLRSKAVNASDITLTDIHDQSLEPFAAQGVRVSQDNAGSVRQADMVVLCVKPYLVRIILEDIIPGLNENTVIVSMAAGITIDQLSLFSGARFIFRIIPNTAMAVNQSMTCIASGDRMPEQEKMVTGIFDLVGKTMVIDESLMNAATVIASCGTAFALRYLRAAMNAGTEIGLRPDVAKEMITQTMLGAAAMLSESGAHPEQEIDKVTTPKGITIKGLNEMERAGFSASVMQGLLAAYKVMDI